jgi:hypothetical protein
MAKRVMCSPVFLASFINKYFSEAIDDVSSEPYKGFDANVFYVALSLELIRNADFRYDKDNGADIAYINH